MQKKQKKVTSKLEVKLITSRKKQPNKLSEKPSWCRALAYCTESPSFLRQIYLSAISYFYTQFGGPVQRQECTYAERPTSTVQAEHFQSPLFILIPSFQNYFPHLLPRMKVGLISYLATDHSPGTEDPCHYPQTISHLRRHHLHQELTYQAVVVYAFNCSTQETKVGKSL